MARRQKENAELEERLTKLPELEKKNANLFEEKANLLEQVGKMTVELSEAKDINQAQQELAALAEKLQKLTKENDRLNAENKDLMLKQSKMQEETKKANQIVSILKNEIAYLKTAVDELKQKQGAPAAGGGSATEQEKVNELKEKNASLQKALDEWTELAKVCRLLIPVALVLLCPYLLQANTKFFERN
jgi:DNA repair exonuclease SbcCD ATPase subunit